MLLVAWDCNQVEQNGKMETLCLELVLGKQAILCVSLNPADVFLVSVLCPYICSFRLKNLCSIAGDSWWFVLVLPQLTTCSARRDLLSLMTAKHGVLPYFDGAP